MKRKFPEFVSDELPFNISIEYLYSLEKLAISTISLREEVAMANTRKLKERLYRRYKERLCGVAMWLLHSERFQKLSMEKIKTFLSEIENIGNSFSEKRYKRLCEIHTQLAEFIGESGGLDRAIRQMKVDEVMVQTTK